MRKRYDERFFLYRLICSFGNSTSFLSGLLTPIYSYQKFYILKNSRRISNPSRAPYLSNIISHAWQESKYHKTLYKKTASKLSVSLNVHRPSTPEIEPASSAQRNGQRSAPFTALLSNLVGWNRSFIFLEAGQRDGCAACGILHPGAGRRNPHGLPIESRSLRRLIRCHRSNLWRHAADFSLDYKHCSYD